MRSIGACCFIFSSYANTLIFPLIFLRRKIFVPRRPTSDVKPYPLLIDAFCGSMAFLEHLLLRIGIMLPAGNSVFIVACKVKDNDILTYNLLNKANFYKLLPWLPPCLPSGVRHR